MNGGKKTKHSPSWPALMDLVQDAKYGDGDTDEDISKAKWEKLEARWGHEFTPAEREEVKKIWAQFHFEMEHP